MTYLQEQGSTQGHTDPRWIGEDLGTFDPDQDDVLAFASRIRRLSVIHGAQLVVSNTNMQLRGKAISWYIYELDNLARSQLSDSPGAWCWGLIDRFKPTKLEILRQLNLASYTKLDVAQQEDPVEFVYHILGLARANDNTIFDGVSMAFDRFDPDLRLTLQAPLPGPAHRLRHIIQNFIDQLTVRSPEWYLRYWNWRQPPPDS